MSNKFYFSFTYVTEGSEAVEFEVLSSEFLVLVLSSEFLVPYNLNTFCGYHSKF